MGALAAIPAAYWAVGAAVAGTAVTVLGQVQASQQASATADYQSRQAQADAVATQERAQLQAERYRKAGRLQASQARAELAAAGVEASGEGTPLRINEEIIRSHEEDAWLSILEGTNQRRSMEAEGEGYAQRARAARAAGITSAAGSLLAGGAQIAGGWKSVTRADGKEG